ncbi:hypothetical protein [Paenibacillus sp. 7516]|uniref:hypothetical protein n=1 Tax=Paenibacillus sp. 7516 TaxID=2022549 RepID=UPI000BA62FC3|nr:hypothetical protein [Paenibacillus sp. 7516]PAF33562.1 hypothetical protein CHI14_02255 [Paenibacillus sp. 7516]
MKKILMSFSSLLLLILITTSIASAQEESSVNGDDMITQRIAIDSNLTIEKRKDGRVVPIKNTEKLSVTQLESILREMKMSDEVIEKMPRSQKEYYASQGGISIPVETKLKRYFRTSDGRRLLVTDENKNEIEALRQKEVAKINNELNTNITIAPLDMGSEADGSFSGKGVLGYVGKSPNATEFEFSYGDDFNFSKNVTYKFTDKIAHAWQSHTTSVRYYGEWWRYVLGDLTQKPLEIKNEGSVYGRSGAFSHNGSVADETGGFLVDIVRIPVSYKGTTGKWVTRYSHPWSFIIPDISIGPISVDFSSYVGDEWEWENTFTIQAQ